MFKLSHSNMISVLSFVEVIEVMSTLSITRNCLSRNDQAFFNSELQCLFKRKIKPLIERFILPCKVDRTDWSDEPFNLHVCMHVFSATLQSFLIERLLHPLTQCVCIIPLRLLFDSFRANIRYTVLFPI